MYAGDGCFVTVFGSGSQTVDLSLKKIMRITVIKSDNKGIKALEFGRSKIFLLALITFVTVVSVSVGTYYLTKWNLQQEFVSEQAISKWSLELETQRNELIAAKKKSEQQIQTLSSRLATMQASILRMDAAGNRLLTELGVGEEFAFDQAPAIGGPENSQSAVNANYLDVYRELNQLESDIISKEQQLNALEALMFDKEISAGQKISGRPIVKGWLSSPYGNRNDPFTGKKAWHAGIDFAGLAGSDVIATAAGVVTTVGTKSGYGKFIEISHGDGFTTRYGHNKTVNVAKGDMVEKGQVIAAIGNTGRSTGPHVHYEIMKNGKKVNPYKYIRR